MTTELQETHDQIRQNQAESGEIVLYQPNENIRLEVRLDNETVWLTQAQMTELFHTTRNNVTMHIRNIFKDGELDAHSVCKDSLLTAADGKIYRTKIYNLDVIISVGYRVKNPIGTRFRQWANTVIKQHLLNGYSINRHLVALQQQVDSRFEALEHKVDEQQQQVEFLVDMHRQPSERIFPTGCVFDAWEYVAGLVREAKSKVILIDNYCDDCTLMLLSKRQPNVDCTIYTRFNEIFDADLEKHNRQYPAIQKVQLPQKEHDRFLMIDDAVYILGDSLKNLGHSMTTVLKTSFSVEEILEKLR